MNLYTILKYELAAGENEVLSRSCKESILGDLSMGGRVRGSGPWFSSGVSSLTALP